MNIIIVEDDMNICFILKKIIEDKNLGLVIDVCTDPIEGQEVIIKNNPDIVLVDMLMPKLDGISLVKNCNSKKLKTCFIMISQVNSKEIIERAYKNGIEFYITKPINAVEIQKVLSKVIEKITLREKLYKIQDVFSTYNQSASFENDDKGINTSKGSANIKYENALNDIMKEIGILGESGCNDIKNIIYYILQNHTNINELTLKELFTKFDKNYKSIEQRIRRTSYVGLRNLANLGIEDYMNETFTEYATSLYGFEEVKKEMDYIRKKSKQGGKVNVKKFLDGILFYCDK